MIRTLLLTLGRPPRTRRLLRPRLRRLPQRVGATMTAIVCMFIANLALPLVCDELRRWRRG